MQNRSVAWNRFLSVLITSLVGLTAEALPGAALPTGFTETVVASGLSSATAMEFAPDGRLFVCQQGGQVRVIKNGILLGTNFLTLTVDSNGERGLLGIAFDPNFSANQYVYLYYTVPGSPPHNRVSRFIAYGDVVLPGSEEVVILDLNNLSGASNHNGGAIHFGADGKLYIAVGENANAAYSQTLTNLLGKMLRLNSNGTIPTDNPFYNTASGNNRAIWARGLRNPYTFAVQPGTGRIFINDVGAGSVEEVNDGIAGANYGWPNCEGACNPPNSNFRDPIHQYPHSPACAITGGTFYNPTVSQFPSDYVGDYFFADYCGGWIRKLDPANGNSVTTFATGLSSPVDLKVSADGLLYYLQRGSVYKIQFAVAPSITMHPADQSVALGEPATFTVSASGTPPLNYQWQRNNVDIPGANSTSYTIASASQSDDGAMFRCRVSNVYGMVNSNPAQLIIDSNTPPSATISSPVTGTFYSAGETIHFAGTGSDGEDGPGPLPPSAFSWTIAFHHDAHTHPFLGPVTNVTAGSFAIPDSGETSANVFYRIHLTVTDSGGMQGTASVDIFPRTSTINLASNPTGLMLTLDGQPVTAPYSVESVVGMKRTIGAVSPQKLGKTQYEFVSWPDGGAITHQITTQATDTTYTATFKKRAGGRKP